jgi:hypothetical protein
MVTAVKFGFNALALAATKVESIPPDKKTPNGTSDTNCLLTELVIASLIFLVSLLKSE